MRPEARQEFRHSQWCIGAYTVYAFQHASKDNGDTMINRECRVLSVHGLGTGTKKEVGLYHVMYLVMD